MESRKEKDVLILKPTEADLADPKKASGVLEQFLVQDGENKVVVDLSKIENIYSIQIGTLVAMHVMCYENVAVMKLAGASRKVRNLLKMVGLESLMSLHHGTKVALESFTSTATIPAVPAVPVDPRVRK